MRPVAASFGRDHPAGRWHAFVRAATPFALGTLAIALAFGVTEQLSERAAFVAIAIALIAVLPVWMFFSVSYGATLLVLALYLGLIDGVLKLKLNTSTATLGRDVLLYAIVGGAVLRFTVSGRPLRLPPLSGYVLAFVLVVLVQVLNPRTEGFAHGLASLRPHLEFVPLFFFGYHVMRSKQRLRIFLLALCVIAAINGVVGFVQFNLTPEQLASWGPGYAELVNGTPGATSRAFFDEESQQAYTRPFALGPDIGFGGAVGVMAVPAFFALLASARRRWAGRIGIPLGVGIVVAIVTSQARTAVLSAIVAAFAYGALTMSSRRAARALLGLAAVLAMTVVGISLLSSSDNSAALSRYDSIAPSKVLNTTYQYRKGTLELVPKYATQDPFGQGLGKVGPAAGFKGKSSATEPAINAESEFNFLLSELGIPGLLIFGALQLKLLALTVRLRRFEDHETRVLLAGCAASYAAIAASWIVGITSTSTPVAPFFWFVAGILAYWVMERGPSRDAQDEPTAVGA